MTTLTLEDTHDRPFLRPARALHWNLVVLSSPDRSFLGARLTVFPGTPWQLGREHCVLEGRALNDPRLSREHCRFEVASDGLFRLHDLGSKNGCFVNREKVTSRVLSPGDLVRVGSLLLSVQYCPALYPTRKNKLFPAIAFQTSHALEMLQLARARSRPFVLVEEAHCETERFVQQCVPAGTLSLPPVCDVQVPVARLLADLERDGILRWPARQGTAERTEILEEVLEGSEAEWVAVPSLRARVEDLPWLLEARLEAHGLGLQHLHYDLLQTLFLAQYPDNFASLDAVVTTLVQHARREPQTTLRTFDTLSTLVGPERASAPSRVETPSTAPATLTLSATGRWFRTPGGDFVQLANRYTLARILACLVRAHQEQPGEEVTMDALAAAAWPGTKLGFQVTSNRLWVAISTLRKLGLRDFLVRRENGYLLLGGLQLRVEPDP